MWHRRGSALFRVNIVLLCSGLLAVDGESALVSSQALQGVAVTQVQPTQLTQLIRTSLTVTLNTSLCENLRQDVVSNAQLILPAAAADGTDLAFRSGASTQDSCTSLQFRVLLGRDVQAGQFPAYVLFDSQRNLQLPVQITVVALPVLSMNTRSINVPADRSAFAVPVGLSKPAGERGVTVQLQVLDSGAAKVWNENLSWFQGTSGTQAFWINLQYMPSNSQLTVQLVQPQGAVVDPAASSTVVLVQSPVIGFKTGLGYYRGINNRSNAVLDLTVSGTSAFPSQFNYSTYLLPGSRPSVPCHPLASTCSVADIESVASVTVSGFRYLQPGQQQLEPIQLPVNWRRLPPEAELRIGIQIVGLSNVRVAAQLGEVAAIIFGTPPGRCPPGSTLLSDTNRSRSSDGPTYTTAAALQELALSITAGAANFSNTTSSNSNSNGTLLRAASWQGSSSSSSSETALDLDPPFSPMVDEYVGLLPPKPKGKGKLLLASNRWGDVVVVDATACLGLNSSRFQVQWWKPQQMWRQQYPLTGQRSPCWLRVHVFTQTDAAGPAPAYDNRSSYAYSVDNTSSDPLSSGSDSSGFFNTSSIAWDLPDDYVLYRTYIIRYVPLKSPEQLSLNSITFSNNDTTVIACGVPRALSYLFETAPPPSLSSIMGMDSNDSSNSSSSNSSSVLSSRSSLNTLLVPGVAGHPRIAGGPASVVSNTAIGSTNSALVGQDKDASQQLHPAPGQVVQVAYLKMQDTAALTDDLESSNTTTQQQQQQQDAAPDAGSQPGQEQYSLFDAVGNRTIVWNKFTTVDCAQDHYVLLPLTQLRSDMKMVPELLDPDTEGVDIQMTQAALALSSSIRDSQAAAEAVDTSSSSDGNSSSSGSSLSSKWELEVKANIFGTHKLQAGLQGLCNSGAVKGSAASSMLLSSKPTPDNSSSSRDPCGLRLPGVTAEVPVILTADEGRSSKTYTLLVYSNESAAAVVQNVVLPQEAAAAESAAKTAAAAGNSSSSNPAADAAALTAAYFAGRPKDWPASPAQNNKCAVCPNGTYSTKVDAYDCKVCPPGKYAASPFSTSCLFCPPGSFSYYWGAPACRKCLPGTSAAHLGSLFCDICKDGTTTYSEGSTICDVTVRKDASALDALPSTNGSEYALLLSFGVVLDGALLETVSRSTTGINGSSEGIVSVLIRSDTATALNVTLGSVQVNSVQQLDSRQLLINVSAAVPVPDDQQQQGGPTADAQDLAADELIQRLIDDPNTFLRTTQTLGAEGVSVQDLITLKTRRNRLWYNGKLHAILWPSLIGSLIVLGLLSYFLWRWRRRRRVQRLTQQLAGGLEFAATAAAGGVADLLSTAYNPRGASPGRLSRRLGLGVGGLGVRDSAGRRSAGVQDMQISSSRSPSWRRIWQRFWGSGVQVVDASSNSSRLGAADLDSPTSSCTIPGGVVGSPPRDCSVGRSHGIAAGAGVGFSRSPARDVSICGSGSTSAGSCGSCSPASTHSGSGCTSDAVSITLDMGGIRPSGAGGGDFCYNEESFQARLRAKQLGAAGAALPARW